jgi:hypothetical protein
MRVWTSSACLIGDTRPPRQVEFGLMQGQLATRCTRAHHLPTRPARPLPQTKPLITLSVSHWSQHNNILLEGSEVMLTMRAIAPRSFSPAVSSRLGSVNAAMNPFKPVLSPRASRCSSPSRLVSRGDDSDRHEAGQTGQARVSPHLSRAPSETRDPSSRRDRASSGQP